MVDDGLSRYETEEWSDAYVPETSEEEKDVEDDWIVPDDDDYWDAIELSETLADMDDDGRESTAEPGDEW